MKSTRDEYTYYSYGLSFNSPLIMTVIFVRPFRPTSLTVVGLHGLAHLHLLVLTLFALFYATQRDYTFGAMSAVSICVRHV